MMKLILSTLVALSLIGSAFAAGATSVTTSPFNAKEFAVSLGSGYVVDTSAAFQQPYSVNVAAGTSYFFTRSLGVEAWVPFYTSKGLSVQEVQAGVVLRLPLAKDDSFFGHFAPYVGVGGVYNWETDKNWAYVAKLGSEFRINSKWGVFVEGQYRNTDFDSLSNGQVNVFGGLKLVF